MTTKKLAVDIVYFKAGGGHIAAARALESVIADTRPDWNVRLVNLQDVLRSVDPVHRLVRVDSQDVYNKVLAKGMTYGGGVVLSAIQAGIRVYKPVLEKKMREHWRRSSPDMVVSVIPNFNGIMYRALQATRPDIPYVTIMTDMADIPGHFWQEKQNQFLICGTEKAVQQAVEAGYPSDRIRKTSGMILKPSFYRDMDFDRRTERVRLGLDPDMPTALIMYGGNGSVGSVKILSQFAKAKIRVQSIVMCGHNDKLRSELAHYPGCLAVGFTENVGSYMKLSDFFMGKPGPASISEAIHMGLPVIVESGRRTMPQERYNARWVEESGVGIAVPRFKDMVGAVSTLLQGRTLEYFRDNAAHLKNRAVFEIPDILAEIIAVGGGGMHHQSLQQSVLRLSAFAKPVVGLTGNSLQGLHDENA